MKQTVLVTGASSGIGYETCLLLLKAGHNVVGLSRSINSTHELNSYANFTAWSCDLSKIDEVADLLLSIQASVGEINALVYAAGVCHHEQFGSTKLSSVIEQINVNLISAFILCEQAIMHMPKESSILLLSSTLAEKPISTSAIYSASKAGLEQITKASALAGAEKKIRVNAVSLGCVNTSMLVKPSADDLEKKHRLEQLEQIHPFGLGQANEVASVLINLLNQPWTTGSVIKIDGGLTLN
ncbi:SDR family NAD(P)-dependent oxidoreductase [Pseudoalteromonas luteoviolacea]|uniref:SDR family NAD(P)-dependent oxidoreductase n=1 Tax=Pseudoalteromonas luteoviolacea TaxID=43657 RepID=UPI001152DCE1|nr:SDR family oxidoreductase [Pseudoalteromonas luteoviolacea]TQF70697.1 SDR family oxidoreductase [Pseudoalteromonas luteoviolacea]